MLENDLLAGLQLRMQMRGIPGLSIRIAQNGNNLFNCDIGVSNLRSGERLGSLHLFKVGCLTKPIIAYAVLHLVNQHRLNLNDPTTCYVPELKTRRELRSITLLHLLCHTAGLARGPYLSQLYPDQEMLNKISSSPLLFAPGEHFKYSNWGYYLLGKVIERVSGEAAEAFIAKEIFTPVGMHSSGFSNRDNPLESPLATGYWKGWYFGSPNLEEPSVPCPHIPLPNCAAGMISTADDYLRWLRNFAGKGPPGSSAEALIVEQMLVSRHKVNSNYSACPGLFVEHTDNCPFYYFAGSSSGFSSFMFMIPEIGLTGIAFANHGSCNNELREILYQICRDRVDGRVLPHFGHQAEKCRIFAGNRKAAVRFRKDGGITEFIRDDSQIRLYPHSANAYFVLSGDCRNQMLRVKGLGKGDAVITLGNQVFYEKLSRLRKQPAPAGSWEALAGIYCNTAFGKVEIIYRESQLYLSYGVAYETLLEPLGELRFKQKPGAFCFETIEFEKNSHSGDINLFVLNGMKFLRQPRLSERYGSSLVGVGD